MRSKPFVSANFDNYFLPAGGDFDNFFLENVKIPTLCPTPPPTPPAFGLDIDRRIIDAVDIEQEKKRSEDGSWGTPQEILPR